MASDQYTKAAINREKEDLKDFVSAPSTSNPPGLISRLIQDSTVVVLPKIRVEFICNQLVTSRFPSLFLWRSKRIISKYAGFSWVTEGGFPEQG